MISFSNSLIWQQRSVIGEKNSCTLFPIELLDKNGKILALDTYLAILYASATWVASPSLFQYWLFSTLSMERLYWNTVC